MKLGSVIENNGTLFLLVKKNQWRPLRASGFGTGAFGEADFEGESTLVLEADLGSLESVEDLKALYRKAKEVLSKAPEPASEYRYGAQNRPPGYGTIPKDAARIDKAIPGIPQTRHGVVVYNRPLSEEEAYSFELARYYPLSEVVDAAIEGLGNYKKEYADAVREDGPDALRDIAGMAKLGGRAGFFTDVPLHGLAKPVAEKLLVLYPGNRKATPKVNEYANMTLREYETRSGMPLHPDAKEKMAEFQDQQGHVARFRKYYMEALGGERKVEEKMPIGYTDPAEYARINIKRAAKERNQYAEAKAALRGTERDLQEFQQHRYWILSELKKGHPIRRAVLADHPDLMFWADPPDTVGLSGSGQSRHGADISDLMDYYKYRNMDGQQAFRQYVIDSSLKPAYSLREFLSAYASAHPQNSFRETIAPFHPNFVDKETGIPYQVTKDEKFVGLNGFHGHPLSPYLRERFIPASYPLVIE